MKSETAIFSDQDALARADKAAREKQALIQKGRGKPNDFFHQQIAATYARFELAEAIKSRSLKPTVSSQVRIGQLTKELKEMAPELLVG